MKYFLSFTLSILIGLVVFSSCLTDTDTDRWRKANNEFMTSLNDSIDIYPIEKNDSLLSVEKGSFYEESAPSGIYYKSLRKGSGKLPLIGQTVTISYTGWLYDNTEFDSGELSFSLGTGTIEGYTAVVQRMHVGDIWKVYIPYYMGYGSTDYYYSSPNIPAYSALIFRMELKSVK